jgi:hypothetical protein
MVQMEKFRCFLPENLLLQDNKQIAPCKVPLKANKGIASCEVP